MIKFVWYPNILSYNRENYFFFEVKVRLSYCVHSWIWFANPARSFFFMWNVCNSSEKHKIVPTKTLFMFDQNLRQQKEKVDICIPGCYLPIVNLSKIVISHSLWYWIYCWYNKKSHLLVRIPVFLHIAHIPKSFKSDQTCLVIVNFFGHFGILSIYQLYTKHIPI